MKIYFSDDGLLPGTTVNGFFTADENIDNEFCIEMDVIPRVGDGISFHYSLLPAHYLPVVWDGYSEDDKEALGGLVGANVLHVDFIVYENKNTIIAIDVEFIKVKELADAGVMVRQRPKLN